MNLNLEFCNNWIISIRGNPRIRTRDDAINHACDYMRLHFTSVIVHRNLALAVSDIPSINISRSVFYIGCPICLNEEQYWRKAILGILVCLSCSRWDIIHEYCTYSSEHILFANNRLLANYYNKIINEYLKCFIP